MHFDAMQQAGVQPDRIWASFSGEWGTNPMDDPASTLRTRPSLLIQVRDAGNNEAWTTFVKTYGPLIFRWSRRSGLQEVDAENVMQEALIGVAQWLRNHDYDRGQGRFRSVLKTITMNAIRKLWRKARAIPTEGLSGLVRAEEASQESSGRTRRRSPSSRAVEDDAVLDREFQIHVLRCAVQRIRDRFAPETMRAFEEVYLRGRDAEEVARELGWDKQRVYEVKKRVMPKVKEAYDYLSELTDLERGDEWLSVK